MSASLKTTASLAPFISRKKFPLDMEDALLYSSEIYSKMHYSIHQRYTALFV